MPKEKHFVPGGAMRKFAENFLTNTEALEATPDERIDRIEEKVDLILAKLDKIFGDAVFVNGQWLSL